MKRKTLLPYVHEYRDRHKKLRRYVRVPGMKRVPLPGAPGTPEYMAAYTDAIKDRQPTAKGHNAGSLGALIEAFYGSAEFANVKPSSQKTYRAILERMREKDGHRLVRDLPPEKARKIIEEIGAKRPGMANLTRSVMRRLFGYAISIGLRRDNPFVKVPSYNLGTHHTWTDAEIAQYEKRWALGTRERLAFALLLYTGQRVSDVVRWRRSDIVDAHLPVVQEKTGVELLIPIHPALARAIQAGPTNGLLLIGDRYGRKIKAAGLSDFVKAAAAKAGLPERCVTHGLRKARLRLLAEHGASVNEIAAISGHQTLREIKRYTDKADQARLARAAMARLPG